LGRKQTLANTMLTFQGDPGMTAEDAVETLRGKFEAIFS